MGNFMTSSAASSAPSSSNRRGQKRHIAIEEQNEAKKLKKYRYAAPNAVPPECWATGIFCCLEYSDVMHISAAAPFFLHEVLPMVNALFITNKNQLDSRQARRFKNSKIVKKIYILSYIERVLDDEDLHPDDALKYNYLHDSLCTETAIRSVSFLQHFPGLEYVMFGGICPMEAAGRFPKGYKRKSIRKFLSIENADICHDHHEHLADNEWKKVSHTQQVLLSVLSSAFLSGCLPKDVYIEGMYEVFQCCKENRNNALWRMGFEAFPMDLLFEEWSHPDCSYDSFKAMIRILSKREGGLDFLRDPQRFLWLMTCLDCRDYFMYKTHRAIGSLIGLGCDPRGLTRDELNTHVCNEEIYISKEDFQKLQEWGFDLQDEDYDLYWA